MKIPAYHGVQCSGEGTGSGNKTRPSVTGGNDSRSQTTKGARPISSPIFPASTRLAFPCLVASRKVDCGRDSWRSTCSRPSYLPRECWAESHFLCSRCARFTSFRREETLRAGSSRHSRVSPLRERLFLFFLVLFARRRLHLLQPGLYCSAWSRTSLCCSLSLASLPNCSSRERFSGAGFCRTFQAVLLPTKESACERGATQ